MSDHDDFPHIDPDYPGLPTGAAESRSPVEIATALGLDQILSSEIRAALTAEAPLCIVIATPGSGWSEHVMDELERRCEICDPETGFEIRFVRREKSERPTAEEQDRIAGWLSRGDAVIGISPMPETMLPPILLRSADHRLSMPPISGATIRTVITEIAGEDPGPLPDDIGGSIDLADLTAAVRWGSSAASCVRRLERAGKARSRSRSVDAPPLETLAGYGAARDWGLALVREVVRFRAGEIPLSALPRGMLMSGGPGVGKTLLAQAIARSARLPLIATSAAQWLSAGHLGECIAAMNADFAEARRLAPAILFIDETDALVDPAMDGSSSSRSWWLSFRAAYLANVDGASTEPGIVLIGACNHPDFVDPALRRAGRLDRHFPIALPDTRALQEIIRLHLAEDLPGIDLSGLAQLATGSTGADVARALREARSRARDAGRPIAFEDLVASLAPPDERSDALRRRIALHEAGHALVAWSLGQRILHASLVERHGGGGRVAIDRPAVLSRRELEHSVMVGLGGRAADTVLGTGPCAGSSSDLAAATTLLVAAESELGLGSSLLACADDVSVSQRLALDPRLRLMVGKTIDLLWKRTLSLVRDHEARIHRLAEAMLARRVLTGAEVASILATSPANTVRQDRLPPPDDPAAADGAGKDPS